MNESKIFTAYQKSSELVLLQPWHELIKNFPTQLLPVHPSMGYPEVFVKRWAISIAETSVRGSANGVGRSGVE